MLDTLKKGIIKNKKTNYYWLELKLSTSNVSNMKSYMVSKSRILNK